MPDLDRLLTSDVSARAADAATGPDFSEVERRGRTRRATRSVLAAACVAAVVAGVVGVVGADPVRRTAPDPAVPSPTPKTNQKADLSPEAIVDDPRATVEQVAVAPGDPDVRAVVWGLCENRRCRQRHVAIAVTGDGFATRSVVGVRGGAALVRPAGSSAFVVSWDGPRPYVLRTDGAKVPIGRPSGEGAVVAGEVVTRLRGYGDDFVAVHPATGAAHRIPLPAGVSQLEGDEHGRLQGVVSDGSRSRYVWSDDGGVRWREHPLPAQDVSMFSLTPSAAPGVRAVIGGADGATFFPFIDVSRGTQNGEAWETVAQDGDPRAYVGLSAVLPDGRMLVDVQAWSDATLRDPGARPNGPYLSAGDDWSAWQRLVPPPDSGLADAERERLLAAESLDVVGLVVAPGAVTVHVVESGAGGSMAVYAVEDGGRTWSRIAVR